MKAYDDDLQSRIELISRNLPWLQESVAGWRTYYTGTVNLELTVYWLLQFGQYRSTKFAIELIKHLNFVDTNRLVALLKRAWEAIPDEIREDTIIAPIGSSYDSSSIVGYSFAKSLGLSETELTSRWGDITKYGLDGQTPPLALIDDNLTSGTQLIRFFSEMASDFIGDREHFKEPLSSKQIEALKNTIIYIVVAVELGNGRDTVVTTLKSLGYNVEVASGTKELTSWLEFGGTIWSSEQDSAFMKSELKSIGEAIFEDKGWPSKKAEQHALGYGNLQRLTVFEHNVPKSLITAFWKYGKVEEKLWIPLFPERKEWAQYESEIRNLNKELKFIADLICSGNFGKATPVCSAYFNLQGERAYSIKVIISSARTVDKVSEYISSKMLPLDHMALREDKSLSGRSGLRVDTMFAPKNSDIVIYNQKVDQYNEQIPLFEDNVRKIVQIGTSLVQLPLRIYNEGTCPASDVVLKIELPESIEFYNYLPSLPKMPDPPAEPTGSLRSLHDYFNNNRSLSTVESLESDVRLVRDRGKTYINIYFGKVLQRTFRDRELKYLLIPSESKLSLPFEIIFNEASRVVEGTFTIQTEPSENHLIRSFVLEQWFSGDTSELEDFLDDA